MSTVIWPYNKYATNTSKHNTAVALIRLRYVTNIYQSGGSATTFRYNSEDNCCISNCFVSAYYLSSTHEWCSKPKLLPNNTILCNAPSLTDEEIHGCVQPWRFASFQTVRRIRNPVTDQRSKCLSRGQLRETGSIFQAFAGFSDLTTTWKARYFALPPQAQSEPAITSSTRNTTKTSFFWSRYLSLEPLGLIN